MLLDQIASELFLPRPFIASIARSASHRYKFYTVPKRGGGTREIYHPSRQLKAIQRWLLRRIILHLPVHDAATAYKPGARTWDNAARHAGTQFLLRMDFEDFFPSITEADISSYLTDLRDAYFSNWVPDDDTLFLQLVCRNGHLTIGAPTSPALSNAICFRLDEQLLSMAARLGVGYTRYADDLFFSANKPNVLKKVEGEVPNICSGLPYPRSLRVNPGKTRHSSKRGRRRVTGLTLGSDGLVHVGRELKRSIRARIHRLESLSLEERSSLAGSISYVVGMEPDFLNSLVLKYGLDRVQLARTAH